MEIQEQTEVVVTKRYSFTKTEKMYLADAINYSLSEMPLPEDIRAFFTAFGNDLTSDLR